MNEANRLKALAKVAEDARSQPSLFIKLASTPGAIQLLSEKLNEKFSAMEGQHLNDNNEYVVYAWVREWEGDASDLGNYCIAFHADDRDDSPNWVPLYVKTSDTFTTSHPLESAVALMKDQLRDCALALQKSTVALDDWTNTFASEFCDDKRVDEAYKRISDEGGTLHYIATTVQQNKLLVTRIEQLLESFNR